MATQTINYIPQLEQIDNSAAEQKIVDKSSQLVRDRIIGHSRWAEKARRLVIAHASHDNTVIFEGESGTGKQFFARLVHQSSRYSEGPFTSVSLGSTTEEAARAVLFGRTRMEVDDPEGGEKGLIELAVGGTLYIDGLMSNSPRLTGDIARFIEYARFNRKGDNSVRILFGSTNSTGGQWRSTFSPKNEGLNCEKVQIPPLRERPDDIEALAAHFIKQSCEQMHKELRVLAPQSVAALKCYDWPRNVAELKSVANHLVRQSRPPSLDAALLPAYMQCLDDAKNTIAFELDLDDEVRKFEIDLICAALRQSRGLQNKAAQLLRVRPTTLFMKIRRYGIEVSDFRQPV